MNNLKGVFAYFSTKITQSICSGLFLKAIFPTSLFQAPPEPQ